MALYETMDQYRPVDHELNYTSISISFFKKLVGGLASGVACVHAYAAHDGICIKIHLTFYKNFILQQGQLCSLRLLHGKILKKIYI